MTRVNCGLPRRRAQLRAQRLTSRELRNAAGKNLVITGGMAECVNALREDFAGAARGARDDGAPTGHGLGDHQTERLRRRAGVHDNVERANRLVDFVDKTGKTDAS